MKQHERAGADADAPRTGGRGASLRADCRRCVGLCCVAPALTQSADFAIDKAAGTPCPNLEADSRCGIHAQLRQRGFPGCSVYDCFGAGQKVAQLTFGGQDWRRNPGLAADMFEVFGVMRQLHELLWYLTEALELPSSRPLRADLSRAPSTKPSASLAAMPMVCSRSTSTRIEPPSTPCCSRPASSLGARNGSGGSTAEAPT